MKKQLEGLNRQEAKKFIKDKEQKKKMKKERARKGLENGLPILIDMVY